jgi:hypothetical protein
MSDLIIMGIMMGIMVAVCLGETAHAGFFHLFAAGLCVVLLMHFQTMTATIITVIFAVLMLFRAMTIEGKGSGA